jgi:hypothetical protein
MESELAVKRIVLIAALLAICLPLAGWLGIYGYAWRQRQLRIADAQPAFGPILPLRAELFSNPCGRRYCCYYLRFPPDTRLSDNNVAQLESLRKLPTENELSLTIETPMITDASLHVLMSLRTVDYFDLTKSSVSDNGLMQLSAALPNTKVFRRESGRE